MPDAPANELRDFGRLVREHYAAVSAVAFVTTRDPVLAEDVVQETFVAAWDARAQLRDPERVRPWLCGIARNQARKALRGRRHEAAETEVADATPSVVDAAVDREALHQLRDALEAIPPEHREPLVLFYWEEHSIAQVASALAISDQAAQKRISRARQYLKDELASRLEPIGRTRKAASAAMATAVVAVLSARPGAAHASPGKKGLSMSKQLVVKGLVAAALAGGIVTGLAIWRGQQSDAAGRTQSAASSGAAAPPTGKAPVPRPQPALPPATAAIPTTASASAPAKPSGWPKGRFPTASAYELTVLGEEGVAVNLAGGKSDIKQSGPPAPAVVRRIRGRVVDEAGRPVHGAAVVISDRIVSMGYSLWADQGAMSGVDGRFEMPDRSEGRTYALALHPRGWSSPTVIPAGRADADLVITIPSPAALTLRVRQGGEGREARLSLTQPGLHLKLDTDERGTAELALLAPGAYRVEAFPKQTPGASKTRRSEHDFTLAAGPNDIALDVPEGALVIATSRARTPLHSVEWFLDSGTIEHPTLDLLRERHAMPGFASLGNGGTKLDGDKVDDAMQFHDLAPGTYTVCVDATTTTQDHLPLACREVAVEDGQTFELELQLRGP